MPKLAASMPLGMYLFCLDCWQEPDCCGTRYVAETGIYQPQH